MHTVAVIAFDQVVAFDLAAACQVFGTAQLPDRRRPYQVRVCAPPGTRATGFGSPLFNLQAEFGLDDAADADTVVVPGHANCLDPPPPAVVDLLRTAADRGSRIASICTGAFVLAAAGLLDGHRVTTHWRYADELAQRYPRVEVDPAALYIDNNNLITSADIAAGVDMCLQLVRRDLGASVAAEVARYIVMPPQRSGGQAQFITHPEPGDRSQALQQTFEWLQQNLHEPLDLQVIADNSALSLRGLNRHFRAQTGTTPMRWLNDARVQRAQQLLETTSLTIEAIAHEVGFGTAAAMRRHFLRRAGTSPHAYRQSFSLVD